jgi:phosphatidylglycerophosphatase A
LNDRGREPARLHWLVRLLATGGYLGYAPVAPASVGSLGCAVLLWFLMPPIGFDDSATAISVLALTVAAFVALSIWVAGRAEVALGHDSRRIVIDEFAGFLVAVAFLPKSALVYVLAFVLFRVLDVLKPFPARRVEAAGGGVGVVLDDLVVGVYTNVLVRIMLLVRGW